jgi:hypothetical protein
LVEGRDGQQVCTVLLLGRLLLLLLCAAAACSCCACGHLLLLLSYVPPVQVCSPGSEQLQLHFCKCGVVQQLQHIISGSSAKPALCSIQPTHSQPYVPMHTKQHRVQLILFATAGSLSMWAWMSGSCWVCSWRL